MKQNVSINAIQTTSTYVPYFSLLESKNMAEENLVAVSTMCDTALLSNNIKPTENACVKTIFSDIMHNIPVFIRSVTCFEISFPGLGV